MIAEEIIRARIVDSEFAFSEIVVWLLDKPLAGSAHPYKYRLAHVVNDENLHFGLVESSYQFVSIDQLLMDFNAYIQRWNLENGNT
jgi:hypothetical protein